MLKARHVVHHVCCLLQSRYSKSVESVVSALVDDTVTLNKRVGGMEGLVNRQQGQLHDTKEALLRWGGRGGVGAWHAVGEHAWHVAACCHGGSAIESGSRYTSQSC
jgi:hypothetical protein